MGPAFNTPSGQTIQTWHFIQLTCLTSRSLPSSNLAVSIAPLFSCMLRNCLLHTATLDNSHCTVRPVILRRLSRRGCPHFAAAPRLLKNVLRRSTWPGSCGSAEDVWSMLSSSMSSSACLDQYRNTPNDFTRPPLAYGDSQPQPDVTFNKTCIGSVHS